jgi:spore coat protein U-like protein
MNFLQKFFYSVILSIFLPALAFAQTNLSTITQARATLNKSCAINATNLNFGAINGAVTGNSATSSINMLCSKNTSYQIQLGFGQYGSVSTGRQMNGANSNDRLIYILCKNPGLTKVAYAGGQLNCTNQSDMWYSTQYVYNGTGNGFLQTVPVYGYTYNAWVTPDTYSDLMTITVLY